MLELLLLDELGQGHLPGLLFRTCQAAELLWIQPRFPGHLDVGIGKKEIMNTIGYTASSSRLRHASRVSTTATVTFEALAAEEPALDEAIREHGGDPRPW